MIHLLEKFSNGLSRVGALISSICFIVLVVLIMTEIIGRSFFDYSTLLADEYSGYLYLATVFFGLGFTLNQEGHIRINLLTSRFSQNTQRYMDVFAGFMATGVMVFALYYSWLFMIDSKEMGMLSENVSETPLYLTQIPIVVGLFVFFVAFVIFTLKRIFDDS